MTRPDVSILGFDLRASGVVRNALRIAGAAAAAGGVTTMRVAVISDIHGNLPALEAVLGEIAREDLRDVWCLGDTVGYGADPNDCCRLIREETEVVLAGNHDLAVAGSLSTEEFSRGAAIAVVFVGIALVLAAVTPTCAPPVEWKMPVGLPSPSPLKKASSSLVPMRRANSAKLQGTPSWMKAVLWGVACACARKAVMAARVAARMNSAWRSADVLQASSQRKAVVSSSARKAGANPIPAVGSRCQPSEKGCERGWGSPAGAEPRTASEVDGCGAGSFGAGHPARRRADAARDRLQEVSIRGPLGEVLEPGERDLDQRAAFPGLLQPATQSRLLVGQASQLAALERFVGAVVGVEPPLLTWCATPAEVLVLKLASPS